MVPPLMTATRRELCRGVRRFDDAIPGDAGTQLGEFVAGVAAGEHVENGFENRAGEMMRRARRSGRVEEVVDVPLVEGDDGDDLLRENIERIARVVDAFDLAFDTWLA